MGDCFWHIPFYIMMDIFRWNRTQTSYALLFGACKYFCTLGCCDVKERDTGLNDWCWERDAAQRKLKVIFTWQGFSQLKLLVIQQNEWSGWFTFCGNYRWIKTESSGLILHDRMVTPVNRAVMSIISQSYRWRTEGKMLNSWWMVETILAGDCSSPLYVSVHVRCIRFSLLRRTSVALIVLHEPMAQKPRRLKQR